MKRVGLNEETDYYIPILSCLYMAVLLYLYANVCHSLYIY